MIFNDIVKVLFGSETDRAELEQMERDCAETLRKAERELPQRIDFPESEDGQI
ncbi:MAG: hypothetical protein MN733_18145 [Nitrososphaera sp.]|nr:hypothetical protein [Nitrososphaera sp.]